MTHELNLRSDDINFKEYWIHKNDNGNLILDKNISKTHPQFSKLKNLKGKGWISYASDIEQKANQVFDNLKTDTNKVQELKERLIQVERVHHNIQKIISLIQEYSHSRISRMIGKIKTPLDGTLQTALQQKEVLVAHCRQKASEFLKEGMLREAFELYTELAKLYPKDEETKIKLDDIVLEKIGRGLLEDAKNDYRILGELFTDQEYFFKLKIVKRIINIETKLDEGDIEKALQDYHQLDLSSLSRKIEFVDNRIKVLKQVIDTNNLLKKGLLENCKEELSKLAHEESLEQLPVVKECLKITEEVCDILARVQENFKLQQTINEEDLKVYSDSSKSLTPTAKASLLLSISEENYSLLQMISKKYPQFSFLQEKFTSYEEDLKKSKAYNAIQAKISHHSLMSAAAAEKGKVVQTERLAREWLLEQESLSELGSSLNAVFLLGHFMHVSLDEFADLVTKELVSDPNKVRGIQKSINETLKSVSYIRHDDLFELIHFLASFYEESHGYNSQIRKQLNDFVFEQDQWISMKNLEKVLENFPKSSTDQLTKRLELWKKNSTCFVRLQDLNQHSIFNLASSINQFDIKPATTISETCQKLSSVIQKCQDKIEKALETGEIAGVFKTASNDESIKEIYDERLASYTAHVLQLSHVLVSGGIGTLKDTQIKTRKDSFDGRTGIIQPFVNHGFKINKLTEMQSSDPNLYRNIVKKINLQSYQDGALFGGATKQMDYHNNNGFLIEKGNHFDFLLFDNGRFAPVDGKNTNIGFFSFFLNFPQFDHPLTPKSIKKIKSWDLENIEKDFQIDNMRENNIKDVLKILDALKTEIGGEENSSKRTRLEIKFKEKEELLEELASTHIPRNRLEPILSGINRLQKLIKEHEEKKLSPPTMRKCYEAMMPLEMQLYYNNQNF